MSTLKSTSMSTLKSTSTLKSNFMLEVELRDILDDFKFDLTDYERLLLFIKRAIDFEVDIPIYRNSVINISKNKFKKVVHVAWRYLRFKELSVYLNCDLELKCWLCDEKQKEYSTFCGIHLKEKIVPFCQKVGCPNIVISKLDSWCFNHRNGCYVDECSKRIRYDKVRCVDHPPRCGECKKHISRGSKWCYWHLYECLKDGCNERVLAKKTRCSLHRKRCIVKGCSSESVFLKY